MNDEHYKAAVHGLLTISAVLESFSAKSSTRRALLLGMAVFHAHLFVADLRDAEAIRADEKRIPLASASSASSAVRHFSKGAGA